MKALLVLLTLIGSNIANAESKTYACLDHDRISILFLINFEEKTVRTYDATNKKFLAADKMVKADKKFKAIGESMGTERTGELEGGGTVSVRKAEDELVGGHYQGYLTFGDRWDFGTCVDDQGLD